MVFVGAVWALAVDIAVGIASDVVDQSASAHVARVQRVAPGFASFAEKSVTKRNKV